MVGGELEDLKDAGGGHQRRHVEISKAGAFVEGDAGVVHVLEKEQGVGLSLAAEVFEGTRVAHPFPVDGDVLGHQFAHAPFQGRDGPVIVLDLVVEDVEETRTDRHPRHQPALRENLA